MSIQERTPSDNYGSVEQPHLEQPSRKCCKIKYRVRYFYSKGAFLVLLWTTLLSVNLDQFCKNILSSFHNNRISNYGLFLLVPLSFCIPLAGWLADAKFGNYKVFKVGSALSFLAATLGQTISVLIENQIISEGVTAVEVIRILSNTLGVIGVGSCLLTALQLGLDQMPDASADNITSFIAWFVSSFFAGIWVYQFLNSTLIICLSQDKVNQIVTLVVPAICVTIICCSLFTFAPGLLIIEPNSPKALKTIYQVLTFAVKHKAPLNRSAFTYWEEDIPSRLDLGKSKYGGPFSTEQVEDAKTFFKILVILTPLFIIGLALSVDININQLYYPQNCSARFWFVCFCNFWWSAIPLYEFGLFPLIRNKLPNMLKRLGILSFLIILIKCSYLATSTINFLHSPNNTETLPIEIYPINHDFWVNMTISIVNGSMAMFLVTGALEFVCAQSPYNMRGLLTSCILLMSFSSVALLSVINHQVSDKYIIVRNSIVTAFSLFGFILHCVLARWYKRRVRDEDYPVHRVVEEIYDRYLSHVNYK